MARPLVREGEAKLDRGLCGRQLLQPGLDALAGPLGRHLLAVAAGPGVQGLDAAQLLDELLFGAVLGVRLSVDRSDAGGDGARLQGACWAE
jgi:hypothetical protein